MVNSLQLTGETETGGGLQFIGGKSENGGWGPLQLLTHSTPCSCSELALSVVEWGRLSHLQFSRGNPLWLPECMSETVNA